MSCGEVLKIRNSENRSSNILVEAQIWRLFCYVEVYELAGCFFYHSIRSLTVGNACGAFLSASPYLRPVFRPANHRRFITTFCRYFGATAKQ